MSSSLALILALVAAPILVFAAVRWRRALLFALPFLVFLNGLPLTVGGSSLRIDQLAACLLVIPLALSVVAGSRRLRTDETTWWLAALLVMNVLASVLNSPARAYSLLQCANLASAWVIYLVLINYLDTREELSAFFTCCLWAALAGSCIGIAAYLFAIVGVPVGGAEVSASAVEHLTRAYGAYGTMVEPNIFGSFTGAFMALALALLAVVRRDSVATIPRDFLRWTAALCAVGLLLSFTRSAWIGALAGMLSVVLIGRNTLGVRASRIVRPLLAGVAISLVLLLLPGSAGEFFRFKLVNLVNLGSRTAALRLFTYTLALQQTIEHPIIGWGTFSFAPLVAQGNDFSQFEGWRNLWIGNYLLLALHDTGIIGLALWIGLLWSIVARGVRATRALNVTEPDIAARALALTAAVVSLLIPFLTTTGFSLGYPWLLIGLLGAHARLAEQTQSIPHPAPGRAEPLIALPADAT